MTTKPELAAVYISLGSNINPVVNLNKAVYLLEGVCQIKRASAAYITPPQGYTEQDDFWNAAVLVFTALSPITLKKDVLDDIERKLGRVRDPNNKNAPRTIDLDISLWNHDVLEYGEKPWRIPDPDILRFPHVVVPLADLSPDYIHPTEHVALAQIAARYDINQLHFYRRDYWLDE
jgi:2-amino-4-hydroxy-6-hydroxymethyldihydropteridine diphosphokinase